MVDALPVTAIGMFFKPRLREMATRQVIESRLAQRSLADTVAAEVLADHKGLQVVFHCGGDAAAAAKVKEMMVPFALRWHVADQNTRPEGGA